MGQRQAEMEIMVISQPFWHGRRVLLTGHTGFKGAWMALLLHRLGAYVTGIALEPIDAQSIFRVADVEDTIDHKLGDISDLPTLRRCFDNARPEVVVHMAAQSLVRRSYAEPVETYRVNVIGTAHVLECIRRSPSTRAVIVVTSDKCYKNDDHPTSFRESDPLGGHDPYSSSKACAELVTAAYRGSFSSTDAGPFLATVRAGNVVGGGDWAEDRLVPDAFRAFFAGKTLSLRNPRSIRPWQFVLDPVIAYLALAERLVRQGQGFAEAWNFGPPADERITVEMLAAKLTALWGEGARWEPDAGTHPVEAASLNLDCAKAHTRLGWYPLFSLDDTLRFTVEWYRALFDGKEMRAVTARQLDDALARCGKVRA
jgi:CDP-glucose 4,6-dehydratase